MSELSKGECLFVVQVLEHDWLEHGSLDFIDMEYCSRNLHDYIRQNSANLMPQKSEEKAADSKVPENIPAKMEPGSSPSYTSQPAETEHIQPDASGATPGGFEILWDPIGTIIHNIVSGLNYIHSKKVVHRDVKPQNGFGLRLKLLLIGI